MASHAILSPSSASKWLACSPSARLEQTFPETTSDFAEEGITAHEVCELLLKKEFGEIKPAVFDKRMKEIAAGKYYNHEMRKYCDDYVDYVISRYNEMKAHTPDARIFFETKVDLTKWIPEGFGTRDVAIVGDGKVIMIDLKYGKGVPVFATENKQLMAYAAGTVDEMAFEFGIESIEIVIAQPRIDNTNSWTVGAGDLMHWAETILKPGAEKAFEGKGEFTVGEHCKFCKAKATCKAMAHANLEMEQYDYRDPALLTDTEIVGILHKLDRLTDWAGALKEHALATALAGKQWPGFKLVEGRSIRKYADEAGIVKVLEEKGIKDIYKPQQLITITAMEGLLTKKVFAELVGPFVVKPPGAPTLVPESDKRPVYTPGLAALAEDVID